MKQPNPKFLTDAFAYGFNARKNKPAELIAKHLDRLMRRGQRDTSDVYRQQGRVQNHRALSTLLLERSASDDYEKAMLTKLKEGYDPEFGMGDHMFSDLALLRGLLYEYRNRLPEGSSQHSLSVMAFQRSYWPFAARKDVDLLLWSDIGLTDAIRARSLRCILSKQAARTQVGLPDHCIGTATLKARFSSATKELTVNLYQTVVLLLFNESVEVGCKQILEAIRMDEGELRRTLQSLGRAKKKVLRKRLVGKDIDKTDVLCFNSEFMDLGVKPEESTRTQSHINGDRSHYLDAAILNSQTIESVKSHFVPEVNVIEQRIARLVEQKFLRRDMNKYIYVA
ncbi:hypothetical protein EDC04DRAFT_2911158 [Pisolithus marmoratus]|nr:hypothetical protein EDC04DRAFT_2911158 [Pisolithus marmoratus]